MSLLFDISTQDEPRKKKRGKKKPPAQGVREESSYVAPARKVPARALLGRLDGEVACIDENCLAEAHDITDEDGGWWWLECCFCGTGQWVPALKTKPNKTEKPASGEFRFPDGTRYAGLTVAEVVEQDAGCREWMVWAAKKGPDEATKKACETYLASLGDPG